MTQGTAHSKWNKTVFVHIDFNGTYLGNGGFVMLANLANELAGMGYPTFVFDHEDRLTLDHFRWLCLENIRFQIAPVNFVFAKHNFDSVIVTSWLNVMLDKFYKQIAGLRIRKGQAISRLRYWCQSELMRHGTQYDLVRRFCLDHLKNIAINNRSLDRFYRSMGFSNITYLENWVRKDLFNNDNENKIADSVGHQPDSEEETLDLLKSRYGHKNVFPCVGDQRGVAEKMRAADFYLFWNIPSPQIRLFSGESFGMSLFEAMACGCVCVGNEHEGNKWLRDYIPLVRNKLEAIDIITQLMSDGTAKRHVREKETKLINSRFYFDKARQEGIKELIS